MHIRRSLDDWTTTYVQFSCEPLEQKHIRKPVSTSNHVFEKATWDKLLWCIFENFEIARVKCGQFQNFQKLYGRFIPKNHPKQTFDYQLITPNQQPLIYFNSRQLQNNTVNGTMSITINHVIKHLI